MALIALGMVITPGPNMMYLVSRSISQGWRAGIVSLAGTLMGFLIYMTMANVGLAAVFVLVPSLFVGLKVLGAAYLLFLAWQTLKPGGKSAFETFELPHDSRLKLFRMGLVTNLLNPKAATMYLALIPQFIRPDLGSTVAQGFALGGVQMTVSMMVNTGIVLTAGITATTLQRRSSWMRWQRRITGTLLGAVGVKLALDAPTPAHP